MSAPALWRRYDCPLLLAADDSGREALRLTRQREAERDWAREHGVLFDRATVASQWFWTDVAPHAVAAAVEMGSPVRWEPFEPNAGLLPRWAKALTLFIVARLPQDLPAR